MAEIELKLEQYGEKTIRVDEEEYKAAKEAGTLDHFLDWDISDMQTDTTIIEPDGTEIYLHG